MSLKSKLPSYPKMNAKRVMRSLASGGCTSTKYWVLMYFEANLPKWTSSKLHMPFNMQFQEEIWHSHDAVWSRQPKQSHSTGYDDQHKEQLYFCRRQIETAGRMLFPTG